MVDKDKEELCMKIVGTIFCVDCGLKMAEFDHHPDDLPDGWHILRPAEKYFSYEGRCPACQYFEDVSDLKSGSYFERDDADPNDDWKEGV